jgi:hypothetical protein
MRAIRNIKQGSGRSLYLIPEYGCDHGDIGQVRAARVRVVKDDYVAWTRADDV